MNKELLKLTLKSFSGVAKTLPDKRTGKHQHYSMNDILMTAFSVFYFQSPSWLTFQRVMETNSKTSNAHTLFGVHKIPSDNHVRDTLDGVDARKLETLYSRIHQSLIKNNPDAFSSFLHINRTLLVAIDGTYYHHSATIHCEGCQRRAKAIKATTFAGETRAIDEAKEETKDEESPLDLHYYHSAITPVIVHPKQKVVIPLFPEFITNSDGVKKQDCEINAAKRWLERKPLSLPFTKLTLLGDDLYSRAPFVELVKQKGKHFIFVCKPSSHVALSSLINMIENLGNMDVVSQVKKSVSNKPNYYTYRFVNDIPLSNEKSAPIVNWCSVDVVNEDNKSIYHNDFITDFTIDASNVALIVEAGRTRWKVENENNNTLKNNGYHLEHNFGHGKKGLSEVLLALNLLAFLFHSVLRLTDVSYQTLFGAISNRKKFFDDMRALTQYMIFDSWEQLYAFMIRGLEERFHITSEFIGCDTS